MSASGCSASIFVAARCVSSQEARCCCHLRLSCGQMFASLDVCDTLARPGEKALGIVVACGRREQGSVLRCDWLNPIWIQLRIYIFFLCLKLGGQLLNCGYDSSNLCNGSFAFLISFPVLLLIVCVKPTWPLMKNPFYFAVYFGANKEINGTGDRMFSLLGPLLITDRQEQLFHCSAH